MGHIDYVCRTETVMEVSRVGEIVILRIALKELSNNFYS